VRILPATLNRTTHLILKVGKGLCAARLWRPAPNELDTGKRGRDVRNQIHGSYEEQFREST